MIGKEAEEARKIRSMTPTEVPVKSHKTMEMFSFAPQSALDMPIVFTFHHTSSAPRNSLLILSAFPHRCPKRMIPFALFALIVKEQTVNIL